MTVKLYIHKLLYEVRHCDMGSRYFSEVELPRPFDFCYSKLIDLAGIWLGGTLFVCSNQNSYWLYFTKPPLKVQCKHHLLCNALAMPPPLQLKWILSFGSSQRPGLTSHNNPTSVYCTVVICGCISLLLPFWAPWGNACSIHLWFPRN